MADETTTILTTSQALRNKCIEAHNVFFKESGYSLLWEVRRSLEPEFSYKLNSPMHLLLSSYGFWGCFEIGGNRTGLDKRLERIASPQVFALHKRLQAGEFAVWRCLEVADEREKWQSLGPEESRDIEVSIVADGKGQRVASKVDDFRAGWFVERAKAAEDGEAAEDENLLLFSMALGPKAAKKIEDAAKASAWKDEITDTLQRAEYERDILTIVVYPRWERCGLEPFYFLPPTQRRNFPRQFGRQLPYEVVRFFRSEGLPWHLRVIQEDVDFLRRNFDPIRKKAGRSARYYRGAQIELPHLRRLVSDEEFFQLIGLDPDGTLSFDGFPPLATHPLALLDLPEEWFKSTTLSPLGTVHQARRHFESTSSKKKASSEETEFLEALTHHESRMRWVSLMRRIIGRDEDPIEGLPDFLQTNRSPFVPDYAELRQAADHLFPTIATLPISELLAGRTRGIKRIVSALEADANKTPATVGDLPAMGYQLHSVEGIGDKSFEMIEEALLEALLSWPAEFSGGLGEAEPEARKEIDQGLDELESLFGG